MAWQKKYLTEEEKSSDTKKAQSRAVWYLSQREHSSAELYEKLCRFFTEQPSAEAVAHMMEYGYLDDEKYARTKANSLLHARKSRREITRKLTEKGVTKDIIESVLCDIFENTEQLNWQSLDAEVDDEEETLDIETSSAVYLIQSKYMRKLENEREDLVIAALMRRGFNYATVRKALQFVKNYIAV